MNFTALPPRLTSTWRSRTTSTSTRGSGRGGDSQSSSIFFAGGARGQHLGGLLDQLDQIAVDRRELQPTCFELGEIEHVVDDREQRIGGAVDALDEAPLHGVEARVEQQLAHAQHAIHRRAQLVIHASHEVALGAAQDLQLVVALFQFVRADL